MNIILFTQKIIFLRLLVYASFIHKWNVLNKKKKWNIFYIDYFTSSVYDGTLVYTIFLYNQHACHFLKQKYIKCKVIINSLYLRRSEFHNQILLHPFPDEQMILGLLGDTTYNKYI